MAHVTNISFKHRPSALLVMLYALLVETPLPISSFRSSNQFIQRCRNERLNPPRRRTKPQSRPQPSNPNDSCRQQRSNLDSINSSSSSLSHPPPTCLFSVAKRQTFLYDGAELESFLLYRNANNVGSSGAPAAVASPRDAVPGVGCVTFLTGTTEDESSPPRRIIGVECLSKSGDGGADTVSLGEGIRVYTNSVAVIPDSVSDADAMSTAAASLVGIHCAVPKVEDVGGSGDGVFYSGKAVVIGGSDYASFVADGLATLGIQVSLVSTGGANTKNENVEVIGPSVEKNDDEIGFSAAIGQFDALIDTIANERKGMMSPGINVVSNPAGVISLLKSANNCHRYISTLTMSQQIVKNEGVLFGPGKANSHVKSLESVSLSKCTQLIPPLGFGPMTLQTLLQKGVCFSSKNNKNIVARGWTMKDFWEETSWPRDSSGTGLRFGLPVMEEPDLDEMFRLDQLQSRRRAPRREPTEAEKEASRAQQKEDQQNPYVTQIVGLDGLAENVISKQRDCVVFVAMRSCRTCKGINPVFTRMAREHEGDTMFAKADATGAVGKALGRQLGVVAVPSFVLFRNGIRYGAVSTSKLPSDSLSQAISDLEAGRDFDPSLEEDN